MVEIKRYKRILTFISLLFILILGYMTYFQVAKADKLKNDEDNKRNWVDDNKLKRGHSLWFFSHIVYALCSKKNFSCLF